MTNKKTVWRKLVNYLNTREGSKVKRSTLVNRFSYAKKETLHRYMRHLEGAGYLEKLDKEKYYVLEAPKKSLTISDAAYGDWIWEW